MVEDSTNHVTGSLLMELAAVLAWQVRARRAGNQADSMAAAAAHITEVDDPMTTAAPRAEWTTRTS